MQNALAGVLALPLHSFPNTCTSLRHRHLALPLPRLRSRFLALPRPTLHRPSPFAPLPPDPDPDPDPDPGDGEGNGYVEGAGQSQFEEKMLFLEFRLGIDLLNISSSHPAIISASFSDVKSTVEYLESMGFTTLELRRMCYICPDILTSTPSQIRSAIRFLLLEAGVQRSCIHQLIKIRPRLLVLDVKTRLRPALYFLQMLGITNTAKYAFLLSCSVENRLVPKLKYLESVGFSPGNVRLMVRRFPPLLCYSIEENLKPKYEFYMMDMGRNLEELRRFPQCFSYNLQRRIIPRHQACKERGLFLDLPALLRPTDKVFRAIVEEEVMEALSVIID